MCPKGALPSNPTLQRRNLMSKEEDHYPPSTQQACLQTGRSECRTPWVGVCVGPAAATQGPNLPGSRFPFLAPPWRNEALC